jgi:hypothetical protein
LLLSIFRLLVRDAKKKSKSMSDGM